MFKHCVVLCCKEPCTLFFSVLNISNLVPFFFFFFLPFLPTFPHTQTHSSRCFACRLVSLQRDPDGTTSCAGSKSNHSAGLNYIFQMSSITPKLPNQLCAAVKEGQEDVVRKLLHWRSSSVNDEDKAIRLFKALASENCFESKFYLSVIYMERHYACCNAGNDGTASWELMKTWSLKTLRHAGPLSDQNKGKQEACRTEFEKELREQQKQLPQQQKKVQQQQEIRQYTVQQKGDELTFMIPAPPHIAARDVKVVLMPCKDKVTLKIGATPDKSMQLWSKVDDLSWQLSDDRKHVEVTLDKIDAVVWPQLWRV